MFKKLKIETLLFAAVVFLFAGADASAVNVSDFSELQGAINGGAVSIVFTTDTINLEANSPAVNYAGPVDFSGDVTLNGMGYYRILNFSNTTASFNGNMNFVNGRSSIYNGGAINNNASNLTFANGNVTFAGNSVYSSGYYGGAIYNTGSINFDMSSGYSAAFSNNSALYLGGAIYNTGAIAFSSGNVMFAGNSVSASAGVNLMGGAVYNNGSMNFNTVSGNTIFFVSNTVRNSGGAIYNGGYGLINFNMCPRSALTFSGNTASYYGGGAIFNAGRINFNSSGSIMTFSNNNNTGEAVFNGSEMNFYMDFASMLIFDNNSGGAISNTGQLTFNADSGSTITFSNNNNGRTLSNSFDARINFNIGSGSLVIFDNNSGAIYNE
ncbi:MAG: hypothetical protein FWC57_04890, partial [Endomicrobia bacterium]|nr:hypothetical protein [Endomicrobiia bacterium]